MRLFLSLLQMLLLLEMYLMGHSLVGMRVSMWVLPLLVMLWLL